MEKATSEEDISDEITGRVSWKICLVLISETAVIWFSFRIFNII
jgi:hypothetical protein